MTALGTAVSASTPSAADTSHGTLIFEDNFNSLALGTTWVTGMWGYDTSSPDLEQQLYRSANETVSGGILTLTAKTENATTSWPGYSGKVFPRTSGMISSDPDHVTPGFTFTYGYVESRIQIPPTAAGQGRGFWPALWMMARDGSPGLGEIDIMEILGDRPDIHHMNYHGSFNAGASYTSPVSLALDYHLYAVDWRAGSIVWYLDGVERFRVTNVAVSSSPHYLILNLAVGDVGSWPGPPDGTTVFPNTMLIDYVRVWQ